MIDLPADPGEDVRIWFLDSEGNQIVLAGRRTCLANQFSALAEALGGPPRP